MKKPKRAKASEHKDGVDRISNLPDHVLQLILSGIPSTEEVIRTSILSTRWRYLWTSVPSIDIDITQRLDHYNPLESDRFKEFVYWVLLNKTLNLDSFRLWCADYYNMSTIRRWIHAAVVRKVKRLDLMFCSIEESEVIELPHCLVACSSLEVLRLSLIRCPLILPNFTGFPVLRVLELKEVDLFGDDIVKYFLESCPLLEDLSLIDCMAEELVISSPKLKSLRIDTGVFVSVEYREDVRYVNWRMCDKLEICCPKLEFLKLTGYVASKFLFENLYSLKKALLHCEDLFTYEDATITFFDEISHVESLSISLYSVEQCYYPSQLLADPISLPNLKTLELTIDALHMLIPFLRCVPDIDSLHLIFVKYVYELDEWNIEEPGTISILTRRLKKVEFVKFNGEKKKLDVARALLKHGKALKEMVFSWGDEARFHERSMKTLKQVSKCHKASSIVKLTAVIDPS